MGRQDPSPVLSRRSINENVNGDGLRGESPLVRRYRGKESPEMGDQTELRRGCRSVVGGDEVHLP